MRGQSCWTFGTRAVTKTKEVTVNRGYSHACCWRASSQLVIIFSSDYYWRIGGSGYKSDIIIHLFLFHYLLFLNTSQNFPLFGWDLVRIIIKSDRDFIKILGIWVRITLYAPCKRKQNWWQVLFIQKNNYQFSYLGTDSRTAKLTLLLSQGSTCIANLGNHYCNYMQAGIWFCIFYLISKSGLSTCVAILGTKTKTKINLVKLRTKIAITCKLELHAIQLRGMCQRWFI